MIGGLLAAMVCLSAPSDSVEVTRVLTNTMQVEDAALTPSAVYVATRGGLELHEKGASSPTLYTTLDGLNSNVVHKIAPGPRLRVRTPSAWCTRDQDGQFVCADAPAYRPRLAMTPVVDGRRVTVERTRGGRAVVGTARDGTFVNGARVTPDNQVCTNFAAALAVHSGALYVGAFDGGLCRTHDGESFEAVADPNGTVRMVNDMVSTPHGLFVAAGEGLFVLREDALTAVPGLEVRAVNALAQDREGAVLATSPGVLWRLTRTSRATPHVEGRWIVGGSKALQDVAVTADGAIWLASEDRGVLRLEPGNFRTANIEHFDGAKALPESWVMRVAPDPSAPNGVLAATLRRGVHRIEHTKTVTPQASPDPWGLSLARIGTDVVVGTQGGAAIRGRDGKSREIVGLPNPNVHASVQFDGCLYLGTEGGLAVACD